MPSLYPYGRLLIANEFARIGKYIRLRGTASTSVGGVPGSRPWASSEFEGQTGLVGVLDIDWDIDNQGTLTVAAGSPPLEFDVPFVDYSGGGATITAITVSSIQVFGDTYGQSNTPNFIDEPYLEVNFSSPIAFGGAGKFTVTEFTISTSG